MVRIDFPETGILLNVLSGIFRAPGMVPGNLSSVSRTPSPHGGTLQAEIVDCLFDSGITFKVLCKYTGDNEYHGPSHKHGVAYESSIYDKVLRNVGLRTARFFGYAHIAECSCSILVLEYLEDYQPMPGDDEQAFGMAAAAIGTFHRQMESSVPDFVFQYTREYYLSWLDMNRKLFEGLKNPHPWIIDLGEYFREHIDLLAEAPQTMVHGEYYTKNIIMKDSDICPVDWESGAAAAGEIDLASLVDARDEACVRAAIRHYRESRWPGGVSDDALFEKRLVMAKTYFYLRWMADDKVGMIDRWSKAHWVRVNLRGIAREAGIS